MTKCYRTLVWSVLEQTSSLCVGGSEVVTGGPDLQCARDGLNRLTIPGTGLAGALVETAGRIFPDFLVDPQIDVEKQPDNWRNRLSGKAWLGEEKRRDNDVSSRQSVWHFYPAHLADDVKQTEPRQGVGIRQATGATATEAKALYDIETIPAGRRWPFFFEIDSLRGESAAEAVAFLALAEWADGRCWLGASAARGLGWMKLTDVKVLRLPLTEKAINLWPSNRRISPEELGKLTDTDVERLNSKQLRDKAEILLKDDPKNRIRLPDKRFCYLTLNVRIEAGRHSSTNNEQYGLDTLSVGGHAAIANRPLGGDCLMWPLGKRPETSLREDRGLSDEVKVEAAYKPDAPVVTTRKGTADNASEVPFLPGGGIRGPFRHKVSAWYRRTKSTIPDPNTRDHGTPPAFEGDEDRDPVSPLFGLVDRSARILIRDGYLTSNDFRLACFQHHAEDEFTAGVYGTGKFDRTAVLKGAFEFQIVVEAEFAAKLREYVEILKPALRLAELGYVPLGGGKYRGHGWLKWQFADVAVGRAGEPGQSLRQPEGTHSIMDVLKKISWEKLGGSS